MGSSRKLFTPLASHYEILVETGTWTGDGVLAALAAGFKHVYSCDINGDFVVAAQERFRDYPVTIRHGASEQILQQLMREIDGPALFFLDAHAMPPSPTAHEFSFDTLTPGQETDPSLQCPIERELGIILSNGYRGHAILIDDRQCFGTWMFHYLSEESVRLLVEEYCPRLYEFSYWGNVLCILPRGVDRPEEDLRRVWRRRIKALLDRNSD